MEHAHQHDNHGDMILLRIDRYEDIFSDFDARPVAERTLSADFIEEIQRQLYMREETITGIIFQIPEAKRKHAEEEAIRERLISYFKKRLHQKQEAQKKIIHRGSLMILTGVVGSLGAAYLTSHEDVARFPYSFFRVLIEPAAWFLLWEGSNQRFFRANEFTPEIELITKISKAHADIRFASVK